VLSTLQALSTQPTWVQYVGYVGLGLLTGCVMLAMFRFVVLYFRLRRNRQIRLEGLEELTARTKLRWLANSKSAEAKNRLEDYLRQYPIQTERERRRLVKLGAAPETLAALQKAQTALLDANQYANTMDWFARFQADFQQPLDDLAAARVAYWSRRAGIVTALSPNGLIDSLATTYFGFAMLSELCQVYHLRAGRTGTGVLLGRVFFHAYLAGQTTEWEKLTEEHVNQLLAPGGPLYELTAARVISKVGSKAAGGMLNYFLLNRLGKYGCRLLRPVSAV
ncbi:MAG: DUF697 domain-containing protein, partial [Gemmataceae bacterium]